MRQGVMAVATIAVKLKTRRRKSSRRLYGNGNRGLRWVRREESRGDPLLHVNWQPAGEAHPHPSVFFFLFFSLPLYFCAHIHISDFSWPSFHPQPHLSVWKLSPLHREPLKTRWLVCFWEQHLWKKVTLHFCIKTAKGGNISWPVASKTLLGATLKWLKGRTTKIREKKR